MFLLIAVVLTIIGITPLLVSTLRGEVYERKSGLIWTAILAGLGFVITWISCYFAVPDLFEPLYGGLFATVLIFWSVGAVIEWFNTSELPVITGGSVALAIIILGGTWLFRSSEMMNASAYGQMYSNVKTSIWTRDVQPKSPEHIRVSSVENALYMAKQALGQDGNIGSQFAISGDAVTLQKVNGHFWYIVPLDHQGWSTWRHTHSVPAYIKVDAEDPHVPAELVKVPEGLVYTPESCWGYDLERHLWENGYSNIGHMDYSPEVDEQGKLWYVITTFDYAVNGWDGKKVTGILLVDPVSGAIKPEPLGQIDSWIDRVIPEKVVQENLAWKGEYPNGDWSNSAWWGAKANMTKPEKSQLVYGSDGDLYWVTGMTSISEKDTSLLGLYYIDSRTGAITYYAMPAGTSGSTDTAIIDAIGKESGVQFNHLHGVDPQIYNISGYMTAIMPILNENNAFQGVGMVDVQNLQTMAYGSNQTEAYQKYESRLSESGKQIAPDLSRKVDDLNGIVDRFFAETQNGNTLFYVHVRNDAHIFTGTSSLSPKLRLTQVGDQITGHYISSGEDVEPMRSFDNQSLVLQSTPAQQVVRAQAQADLSHVEVHSEAATIRANTQALSDEQLVEQQEKKQKH